mmetsp:Transcript_44318/g.128146  ORF Transcript_44318/g.128146 Transcript_44318/m.128146 type:complete len:183 (+) Transcript_44318:62-610(+)
MASAGENLSANVSADAAISDVTEGNRLESVMSIIMLVILLLVLCSCLACLCACFCCFLFGVPEGVKTSMAAKMVQWEKDGTLPPLDGSERKPPPKQLSGTADEEAEASTAAGAGVGALDDEPPKPPPRPLNRPLPRAIPSRVPPAMSRVPRSNPYGVKSGEPPRPQAEAPPRRHAEGGLGAF